MPYISEEGLYEQFHLDEPWDSPHNIELLAKMPRTYEPPRGKPATVDQIRTTGVTLDDNDGCTLIVRRDETPEPESSDAKPDVRALPFATAMAG